MSSYTYEQRKLFDLVEFISGKNLNRLPDEVKGYTIKDFEYDNSHPFIFKGRSLIKNSDFIVPGDIIVNLITGEAAIANERMEYKYFSQQFSKVILKENICSSYFLYLMNEEPSIQKQKKIYSTGSINRRLSIKGLGQFIVTVPHIEKQELIGEAYIHAVNIHTQSIKEVENIFNISLNLLNEYKNKIER